MVRLYNIGIAQVRLGNHADAISELEAGLKLPPEDPRIVSALARELATAPAEQLRDGGRAVGLASLLLQKRPQDPAAMELLGTALIEEISEAAIGLIFCGSYTRCNLLASGGARHGI